MAAGFRSRVEFAAANLAVIVAVLHLSLGILYWIRWARAGILVPRDIRWPLFVASGLVILLGGFLASRGYRRRQLYVGGIALMVVYIVGYFGWHALGHRPLLIVGPATPDVGPLIPFLVDHLFAGPVEFIAIVTETALIVLLGYLLATEPGGEGR